jgi:hypothetical protein
MLLLKEVSRIEARSTKELSIDELSMLRVELGSSKAVAEAERDRRPKRGGVTYPFVSLLLLAMWKEIRNQTYKGVLKGLDGHDLVCLGLDKAPSVGTLCHFVTRVLPKYCESIGDEISEAVLKVIGDRVFTIDSTPLEEGRYNYDAKFSPHYEIRMDKSHILMVSGFPLRQIHTDGLAGDCPRARLLVDMMRGIGYDRREDDVLLTDGAYDNFILYADVWLATGTVMVCNHGVNARFHADVDDARMLREFNSLRGVKGYDPEMKRDMDSVLRFLCRNGRKEIVGVYLRNISMLNSEEYDGADTRRQVCESAHRAFKRWMQFDIRGLRKVTRKVRIECRFLFLQLLSTLFKGCVLTES